MEQMNARVYHFSIFRRNQSAGFEIRYTRAHIRTDVTSSILLRTPHTHPHTPTHRLSPADSHRLSRTLTHFHTPTPTHPRRASQTPAGDSPTLSYTAAAESRTPSHALSEDSRTPPSRTQFHILSHALSDSRTLARTLTSSYTPPYQTLLCTFTRPLKHSLRHSKKINLRFITKIFFRRVCALCAQTRRCFGGRPPETHILPLLLPLRDPEDKI
jgi:hypothetical protein